MISYPKAVLSLDGVWKGIKMWGFIDFLLLGGMAKDPVDKRLPTVWPLHIWTSVKIMPHSLFFSFSTTFSRQGREDVLD